MVNGSHLVATNIFISGYRWKQPLVRVWGWFKIAVATVATNFYIARVCFCFFAYFFIIFSLCLIIFSIKTMIWIFKNDPLRLPENDLFFCNGLFLLVYLIIVWLVMGVCLAFGMNQSSSPKHVLLGWLVWRKCRLMAHIWTLQRFYTTSNTNIAPNPQNALKTQIWAK